MEWNDRYMTLFRDAVERYHQHPQTVVERFFLPDELEFLEAIGSGAAEMHAYVQEYATKGEPSPCTVLLIAAARRSFFLTQQKGIHGHAKPVRSQDLPPETAEFQEIAYLPRIISKATAKLYGTLDASVPYYDEKDRQFLREHGGIHPADFLYLAWRARGGSDKQRIVMTVLQAMAAQRGSSPVPAPSATPAPAAASKPAQPELPL